MDIFHCAEVLKWSMMVIPPPLCMLTAVIPGTKLIWNGQTLLSACILKYLNNVEVNELNDYQVPLQPVP